MLKACGKSGDFIVANGRLLKKRHQQQRSGCIRFGAWNAGGWSKDNFSNYKLRELVVQLHDCDIFAICETFLRGNETLSIENYTWVGNIRLNVNPNARRGSFLNCENSLVLIADCINRIETHLNQDKNVSDAYTCFVKLIVSKMQSKLKCIQISQGKGKTHTSRSKPFWNTELQDMWNKVYSSEKQWLKFQGSTVTKNRLRQEYCYVRNAFDKMLRKAKRNYQLSEQQSLRDKLYNTENPREFWTEIGKIGMANDRKSRIPFEVSDQDGIKTDRDSVLGKWKSDYEHLYNQRTNGPINAHLISWPSKAHNIQNLENIW